MKKKVTSVLYIKDNCLNWIPVSEQTNKMWVNINSKIKSLGEKFYKTKDFFERMNYRRENLYSLGKCLEQLFQNNKIGIHLQVQTKRSKDALYCWFAENFYDELFNNNSIFLESLKNNLSTNSLLNFQNNLNSSLQIQNETNKTSLDLIEKNVQLESTINTNVDHAIENCSQLEPNINLTKEYDDTLDLKNVFSYFDNNPTIESNVDYNDILNF